MSGHPFDSCSPKNSDLLTLSFTPCLILFDPVVSLPHQHPVSESSAVSAVFGHVVGPLSGFNDIAKETVHGWTEDLVQLVLSNHPEKSLSS